MKLPRNLTSEARVFHGPDPLNCYIAFRRGTEYAEFGLEFEPDLPETYHPLIEQLQGNMAAAMRNADSKVLTDPKMLAVPRFFALKGVVIVAVAGADVFIWYEPSLNPAQMQTLLSAIDSSRNDYVDMQAMRKLQGQLPMLDAAVAELRSRTTQLARNRTRGIRWQ